MSVKTFGYINILVSPSMFFEVNSCYYFFFIQRNVYKCTNKRTLHNSFLFCTAVVFW